MTSPQDMASEHRRAASVPDVKIEREKDRSSPAKLPDSAHLSPVRSQSSLFQLEPPAQRDATAAANRSAAQLRRVAMRLATRLAVSDSRASAQAKSLQRACLSQYTGASGAEAQLANLCSTLDEKEHKSWDLVAILAKIAPIEATTPLMPLESIGEDNMLSPPQTPRTVGRPSSYQTWNETGHAGASLDAAYYQVHFLRNELEEHQKQMFALLNSESYRNKMIATYQQEMTTPDNSGKFLLHDLDSDKAENLDMIESHSKLVQDLLTERNRNEALDSEYQQMKSGSTHLQHANAAMQADMDQVKQRAKDLQRANDSLERNMQTAREKEERLRQRLGQLQHAKANAERSLREATDGKENLENEVQALSTLNGRLAIDIQEQNFKLSALENVNRECESKIRDLEIQRDAMDQQRRAATQEISKLREFDSDRKTQLGEILQHTESVEAHIESALERMEIISDEYARHKVGEESMVVEREEAREKLGAVQLQLTAASNIEDSQRSQLGALQEREDILTRDIKTLQDENVSLALQLGSAHGELDRMRRISNELSTDLGASRTQSTELSRSVEEARRHNHRLEESLIQCQKEKREVSKKLTTLGSRLYSSLSANSRLLSKLSRFETDLRDASEEIAGLESQLDNAENAFAARDKQFSDFVEESEARMRDQEKAQQALEDAKRAAETRLSSFGGDIGRLTAATSALQNVLDALHQDLQRVKQQHGTQNRRLSFRQERRSKIGADTATEVLEDELEKLQETKSIMDRIVAGLIPDPEEVGIAYSRQGSTAETSSTLELAVLPNYQRPEIDVFTPKAITNFSRQRVRGGSRSTSRSSSFTVEGSQQFLTSHLRRKSSWSSSESTFSGKKHVWFKSNPHLSTQGNLMGLYFPNRNDVQIVDNVRNISSPKEEPATKRIGKDTKRLATTRNSIEGTRLRCRSTPNLHAAVETWQVQCESDEEDEVPPVPFLEDGRSSPADSLSYSSIHATHGRPSSTFTMRSVHRIDESIWESPLQTKKALPKSPEIPEEADNGAGNDWGRFGTTESLMLNEEGIRKSRVRKIHSSLDAVPNYSLQATRLDIRRARPLSSLKPFKPFKSSPTNPGKYSPLSPISSNFFPIPNRAVTPSKSSLDSPPQSPPKDLKAFNFENSPRTEPDFGTVTDNEPNSIQILRKSKSSSFVRSKRHFPLPQEDGDRNRKGNKKGWVGSVMEKVKGSKLKYNARQQSLA